MPTLRFAYEGARAEVVYAGNDLYILKNLTSSIRRKGHAKGVLQEVITWADQNRVILLLAVQAYGRHDILDNRQLEMFYTRFGFKKQPDQGKPTRMIRYPNRKGSTP